MEKEKSLKLFEAIKNDDLKTFSSLLLEPSDFSVCFGRFPLLSCLYLYQSYEILSKYESRLLRINKFEIVDEPFELYKKFKSKAKKSLRLFLNNELICYPILMLGILDERKLLLQNYKNLYKTVDIVQILNKIYILNVNLNVNASTDKLILPRKKLSVFGKLKMATICFILVFAMLFSVCTITFIGMSSGIGTSALPILIANEEEFKTALQKGNKCYKLSNNIELVDDFQVSNFSGVIDGNGKTLKIANNSLPLFLNFSGTISNLKFEVGKIEKTLSQNLAIIAEKSSGTITNVEINCEIDISFSPLDDTYFSCFVVENSGVIESSVCNLFGSAKNLGSTNCYVTGFVGINSGKILNSKTDVGEIVSDTVDIAGFAISNSGTLSRLENNLKLTQTSEKEWHPNSSGIANVNSGLIEYSVNNAEVKSASTLLEASDTFFVLAGGIACDNVGEISNCRNFGKISAEGDISNLCVGGIVSRNINSSNSKITNSKSKNNIYAVSKSGQVFAGGIAGYSSSVVSHCGFEGEVSIDSETAVFAGGIAGYNVYRNFDMFGIIGNGNVSECYTVVKFSFINADNMANAKCASIVGVIQTTFVSGTVIIIPCENNHYVKDSSFVYSIYVSTPLYFSSVEDSQCGANSYEKLEDIDSEVILDDKI